MGEMADLEIERALFNDDIDLIDFMIKRRNKMPKTEAKEKKSVMTDVFRLGFHSIFEPKAPNNKPDEKKIWQATAIFDNDADFKAMKSLEKSVAQKKWPDGKPKKYASPFVDGEERTRDDGSVREEYEEKVVLYLKNRFNAPGVVDEYNRVVTDPSKIYSGCYCRAYVSAFAWTYQGKCGVSFTLEHIQKVNDGEPLQSKSDPTDIFKAVKDLDDEEDDDEDAPY